MLSWSIALFIIWGTFVSVGERKLDMNIAIFIISIIFILLIFLCAVRSLA